MAHKICTLDADWYRHPMTNRYWSNYTTCVDTVDLAVSVHQHRRRCKNAKKIVIAWLCPDALNE